ncbi:hypothetical protein [Dorea sp. D27]|uniref:hypothetical protein n=1 Tax=Dorea sp. D27 TaxID=658665 RepID=UPI0006734476|nr:hypothetical protein [Dorea sp. D27]RGU91719.1 hypothetical protein DWW31_14020 [Clostridium sp. AF15-17LB]
MNYRQIILYAIRTPYGENILEGEYIGVRTKSGNEYYGILHDAGSGRIQLAMEDDEVEYLGINYDEIESLAGKGINGRV